MGEDATVDIQRELARRIRRAREAAKLTQEDVAAAAGIDYKRLQRIEAGSVNPTVRTLVRVATALQIDFWALMRGPRAGRRRRS